MHVSNPICISLFFCRSLSNTRHIYVYIRVYMCIYVCPYACLESHMLISFFFFCRSLSNTRHIYVYIRVYTCTYVCPYACLSFSIGLFSHVGLFYKPIFTYLGLFDRTHVPYACLSFSVGLFFYRSLFTLIGLFSHSQGLSHK